MRTDILDITGPDFTKTSTFDYYLPKELIAQDPVEPKRFIQIAGSSHKDSEKESTKYSGNLKDHTEKGDLLVLNDTKGCFPHVFRGSKKMAMLKWRSFSSPRLLNLISGQLW